MCSSDLADQRAVGFRPLEPAHRDQLGQGLHDPVAAGLSGHPGRARHAPGALPESAQMIRFFVAACAGATRVEIARARAVRTLNAPKRFFVINFLHGSICGEGPQSANFHKRN